MRISEDEDTLVTIRKEENYISNRMELFSVPYWIHRRQLQLIYTTKKPTPTI